MSRYDYKILVVCGPSGSGKSSLLKKLFDEYPTKFGFSVSHTTRSPRPGEEDGVQYHFTTLDKITKGISEGRFLESATFSGNMYGTSLESVQQVCMNGKVCVLDIDVQGVKQVKEKDLDLILVFIKPPSMKELEKRLRDRATESEEALQKRLNVAKKEMEYGECEGNFNTIIVNDDLEKSYQEFKKFVISELQKRNIVLDVYS